MKAYIPIWFLLTFSCPGLAQPISFVAIEDPQFEAQFAQHFFIDEALDAELTQYFSFSGYPGYAFIDQKGIYKPGAITWLSAIKGKDALAPLLE